MSNVITAESIEIQKIEQVGFQRHEIAELEYENLYEITYGIPHYTCTVTVPAYDANEARTLFRIFRYYEYGTCKRI